jgi:hypothetical protein
MYFLSQLMFIFSPLGAMSGTLRPCFLYIKKHIYIYTYIYIYIYIYIYVYIYIYNKKTYQNPLEILYLCYSK